MNKKDKTLDELIKERESQNANDALVKTLRDNNLILTENSNKNLSDDQLLTTEDICKLLRCDRHLVYSLAESKQLVGFKQKGWKFSLKAYRDYVTKEMNASE